MGCTLLTVIIADEASGSRPRRRPAVSVPPATAAPEQVAEETIPADTLQEMYEAELGDWYDPDRAEDIYEAHRLIEQYFQTPSAKARPEIVRQIEAIGLAPTVVGRITRLRMHWPALEGGGVFYTNERQGPHDVRYFLGVPKDYDRTKPWPLVVKLPTAHAFITDPPPGPDEVVRIYTEWINAELAEHPDALVLMPLLNLTTLYGPSTEGMNNVIQPVLHAAGRVNIDPARVYLVGHSMSGHAAWNLALHYPTYFAAFNPLAGAASGDWQRLRLMNLSNVLPVVWHDAKDDVIKVGHSRNLVKALRGLKIEVEYEETKSGGHAPSPEMAERAYQKTRARTRELYPQAVLLQTNRPEMVFSRNDWVQIFQPASGGKQRRLLISRGGGSMKVYQNAFKAQAAITRKNYIEVKTTNVSSLRLLLNDQMVDFAKPITVVVNKKPRFEGKLEPSVEPMLKDQVFLGRGWRYYTAVIDIDVTELPGSKAKAGKSDSPGPGGDTVKKPKSKGGKGGAPK